MRAYRGFLPVAYRLFNDAGSTLYILISRHDPFRFIEKNYRLPWVPFVYDWEILAEGLTKVSGNKLKGELIDKYKPLFTDLNFATYTQPVNPNPIPRSDDQARLITYALRNVPKR
jgi:hypothetical protein